MWLIKKKLPLSPTILYCHLTYGARHGASLFWEGPKKQHPFPWGIIQDCHSPPPFANLSFLQHAHTSGPYLNRYNSDYCTRKIFGYGSEIGLAITKNMKTYFDRAEIKLSHGTSPCSNTSGDTVIKIFTLAVTLAYTKNVAIATMMIHFNRAYILLHRAFQWCQSQLSK